MTLDFRVISGVVTRVNVIITHIRGLITPLITTMGVRRMWGLSLILLRRAGLFVLSARVEGFSQKPSSRQTSKPTPKHRGWCGVRKELIFLEGGPRRTQFFFLLGLLN